MLDASFYRPMAKRQISHRIRLGLVLIEMLMVLGIIAFLMSIAMLSFSAVWGNMYFQRKAEDLVAVMQTAWSTAQQSERRYVVELSFKYQMWWLDEIMPTNDEIVNSDDESDPDDESIKSGYFDDRFILDYVQLDDGFDTRFPTEGTITIGVPLEVGRGGWQYGGKVVLRDEDGNPWSILFYRVGKPVELVAGDIDILRTMKTRDMRF